MWRSSSPRGVEGLRSEDRGAAVPVSDVDEAITRAHHDEWARVVAALTRWLLENDLVDEMTLIVIPVILGQGARLFPETGPDLALDLVESRVDSKGVTIQVFRPAGRPQYAPVELPRHLRR